MSVHASSFPTDPDGLAITPDFVLTAMESEEAVELLVSTPTSPNIRFHASAALMFGLAIMTLDQDGTIERRMEQLIANGPINEVDAVNRINLLLLKDANDQRV
jgi:hypothetical protein